MDLFRNIVVGIDISGREHLVGVRDLLAPSRAALEKAAWLAERNGAHLHVLSSLEVDAHAQGMIQRDHQAGRASVLDIAAKRLREVVDKIVTDDVETTMEVGFGRPSQAIMEDVAARDRDLVVVGTRERGRLAATLFGSTAQRLMRKCPVPVWVARYGPSPGLSNILAPVEPGDLAPAVLAFAASLAEDTGAILHVLHVVDYSGEQVLRMGDAGQETVDLYRQERRAAVESAMAELMGGLDASIDTRLHLEDGVPSEVIAEKSQEVSADVVVMGSVSRSGIQGLLLGSTTENVLHVLDTSLVILKPDDFVSPADTQG